MISLRTSQKPVQTHLTIGKAVELLGGNIKESPSVGAAVHGTAYRNKTFWNYCRNLWWDRLCEWKLTARLDYEGRPMVDETLYEQHEAYAYIMMQYLKQARRNMLKQRSRLLKKKLEEQAIK